MFGPAPSDPRLPYPYLPVFFPASLLFGHLPDSSLRFLLSRLGGQNPRSFPAFALRSSKFRSARSSFSQGHEIPDVQAVRSSVLEPRSFPTMGRVSGSPPFFHPGVIRQPRPEAFYGASEYAVERAGPYPHRLFSSPRLPGILFALCSVKPCFPSVFGLSASIGNISSLPLLPECRSGSESEQRPSDNMTCCRPIFGSPDGRPARRGADAAGRLCRRNGMNGCPCDIEEKEKSHNDGYATFVPSCFSGLCFPSSLEMRISGSR